MMLRNFSFTVLGVTLASLACGQIKKQFTVEDNHICSNIKLSLQATSGNCFIKPGQEADILNVFSNQDGDDYSHNIKKQVNGKTCEVVLSLEENQTEGVSRSLSTRFFGSESNHPTEHFWKMYLTAIKPYMLELNYGVGKANVDLSGLSINKLKINTGSADVNVGYMGLENQVDMDTFYIKVDLGSVNVKNLCLSRARYMVADVGFGNVTLDFGNKPLVSNKIKGSVGAGNLVIILPSEETPILVTIHDSWLCSVKLPERLKKIGENTFANAAYNKNSKNTLTFDVDVSMGHIIFKDKQ
jgi:hypothetical protein